MTTIYLDASNIPFYHRHSGKLKTLAMISLVVGIVSATGMSLTWNHRASDLFIISTAFGCTAAVNGIAVLLIKRYSSYDQTTQTLHAMSQAVIAIQNSRLTEKNALQQLPAVQTANQQLSTLSLDADGLWELRQIVAFIVKAQEAVAAEHQQQMLYTILTSKLYESFLEFDSGEQTTYINKVEIRGIPSANTALRTGLAAFQTEANAATLIGPLTMLGPKVVRSTLHVRQAIHNHVPSDKRASAEQIFLTAAQNAADINTFRTTVIAQGTAAGFNMTSAVEAAIPLWEDQ